MTKREERDRERERRQQDLRFAEVCRVCPQCRKSAAELDAPAEVLGAIKGDDAALKALRSMLEESPVCLLSPRSYFSVCKKTGKAGQV